MNIGAIEKEAGYETARAMRELLDRIRDVDDKHEKNVIIRKLDSLIVGNDRRGDYLEFSVDGIKMYGSAQGWQDLRVASSSIKASTTTPPDWGTFIGNINAWLFAGTGVNAEEVFFELQLPHGINTAEPLQPHVHVAPMTSGGTGNIKFFMEYTLSDAGDAFPAATTVSGSLAVGAQYEHMIIGLDPGIDISGVGDSAIIMGRVYRDPADAGDTYGNDVALLSIDFHHVIESFGSDDPIGDRPV